MKGFVTSTLMMPSLYCSFAILMLMHILRTSPSFASACLQDYDTLILGKITNIVFEWVSIRSAINLAPSDFLV